MLRTLQLLTGLLLIGALLTLSACPANQSAPIAVGPPLSAGEEAAAHKLVKIAEVDPERVNADQRRRMLRMASGMKCPCEGVPGTLGECAEQRATCVRGPFAVRSLIRGILRADPDEKITARMLERFGPREPEVIKVVGVPCQGPESAPVLMVIFSDFECPYCGLATKLVEEVRAAAGDKLRVCFKHYPLSNIHKLAELAARAAAAAQLQGKFWPMHDRLFANAKSLSRDDLLDHADAVGLDKERFAVDLDGEAAKKRVDADAADAARLRISGTPTFFINGRRMTDPKNTPTFLDWIAEAIALKKQRAR
jgi:predicted DsbA family dithiol-disulfide isomerase